MKIKLQKVRLSFPDIWHSKEFKTGDGKPRFNATFLVEPGSANDKAIQQAIKDAAAETHGAKAAKFLAGVEGNSNKYAYLDGDKKEYDGYEGMMYLACHSKVRPTILDRDKTPLAEDDGKPYAGCYVNAIVDVYTLSGDFPGMFASFSGLQFHSDGDAFAGGGRAASADEFEDLGEGADADDMS